MKTSYGQVMLVDGGGFFPEQDNQQDIAWFLMDAMKVLGTDAVGVSERELRWGVSYLKYQVKRTQLSVVCANLLEAPARRTVVEPYVIKKVGTTKVGAFGLISDKVDLGPSRDSLRVEEPAAAARRVVAEMRKKGATVVVLLSQLGKVESEDLVAAVPGIDAVVCGHSVPLIQKGRMIKNTVASYGGEQGQYLSHTVLTLNAQRHAVTGENESFILGPEVGERPEVLKLVKDFEDAYNEKLRKAEKEQAVQTSVETADHYLGAELCGRCHEAEAKQWKTTSHAVAWQTLIDAKQDQATECIRCHVVGYKAAGGFQNGNDAARLGGVQCENCHGMGTQHEAFATTARHVTDQVCITCHSGENDPGFNYDKKLLLIAHNNSSGETLAKKKAQAGTMKTGMKTGSN